MPCLGENFAYTKSAGISGSSFQAAPLAGSVAVAVSIVVVVPVAVVVIVALVMAATVVVVVVTSPIVAVVMPSVAMSIVSIGVTAVPAVVRPWVGTTGPVTAIVGSSIRPGEAMRSPSMGIAPIGPGADAEKDSVIEVARPIESRRGAGVGRKLVIAVRTDGRSADLNAEGNLGIGLRRERKKRKRQGRAKEREGSAPEEGFSFRDHIRKDTVLRQ